MEYEDCKKDNEYILVKDLKLWKANIFWKYSTILCCIIFSIIFALIWAKDEEVGEYLGFSGTILSIVLSVIAILITLVDVAGQKGQVLEIAETSKSLKNTVNELNEDNQRIKAELEALINDKLLSNFKNMNEFIEIVKNNFVDESEKKEFEELISQFNVNMNKELFLNKNKLSAKYVTGIENYDPKLADGLENYFYRWCKL
ncbi:hypothetical protein [Macrococcus capreoli]|uniref:hypothetical protein n=1 Tax=Macrococcus capreoli TaxID=2982690 RepID=UPI003EE5361F